MGLYHLFLIMNYLHSCLLDTESTMETGKRSYQNARAEGLHKFSNAEQRENVTLPQFNIH
jgi:hypothetical protein